MPLLQDCKKHLGKNPMDWIITHEAAVRPTQGDHVFGDVIGMVETSLQRIIDDKQGWETTSFQPLSDMAYQYWLLFKRLDLGHKEGNQVLVTRQSTGSEKDQHAEEFGKYAHSFQRIFCEIVCWNEDRTRHLIGGGSLAWRRMVMGKFEGVLDHLVDGTALDVYLCIPVEKIRKGHPAISLHKARLQAGETTEVTNRANILNIRELCQNYSSARNYLQAMLSCFLDKKWIWNQRRGSWEKSF